MAKLPKWDAGVVFDATSLTGSYQDVGSALTSPALGFVFYNTSDVDVRLSFDDGATDGPVVPASGSFSSSPFSQDEHVHNGTHMLESGAQVQVKQVTGAGTSGNLIMNIARQ